MDTCFIIGCHPGLLWFIWSNGARQTIENLIQGLGTEKKCGIESPTKYGGVLRGRKQNTKYSVTQYVNHEHKLQLKWGMYEWILHDGIKQNFAFWCVSCDQRGSSVGFSCHVGSCFKTERWSLNAVGLTRGANAYTTIKLNSALGNLHMQNLLLFSFIHVWSCKAVNIAAVFWLWATTKAQAIEWRQHNSHHHYRGLTGLH